MASDHTWPMMSAPSPRLPPGRGDGGDPRLRGRLSEGQAVAAVDLGSNSFHMVAAEVRGGQLVFVDRRREFVRLAAGLDQGKRLTPEATARALACLDRFGERLRSLPSGTVRVVGTNTMRRARNARGLLEAGERSLGHPVEIISGLEEARLIYLGASREAWLATRRASSSTSAAGRPS